MTNAIEIRDLTKQYAGFKLNDISFDVPSGSIVGFVGENGAGKTTTIKCILDIAHKDSGQITLLGHDSQAEGALAKEDIGVVFDECSFHDWLRVDQVGKILKNIYKNWDEAYYQELLARFGLAEAARGRKTIKTFSRGMKMKLSLATALAHRPKLLILDEATSGLDPIVRDEILDLFLEFIQDEGNSILFSSHITSDIEKAADYLVFIHKGKIILNAEKDELLANYGVIKCGQAVYDTLDKTHVRGTRQSSFGVEAPIDNRPEWQPTDEMLVERASVDDIMLFTIRGTHP